MEAGPARVENAQILNLAESIKTNCSGGESNERHDEDEPPGWEISEEHHMSKGYAYNLKRRA